MDLDAPVLVSRQKVPKIITPVHLLVNALEMESANVRTAGEEARVPEGNTVKWMVQLV